MDAKPFKPCRLGDGSPRPLEIDAGLPSPISGNDMGVAFEMRERREDGERRRAQIDRLLAGLAVGQEMHSTLEVDELPAGMQNFAQPCAGQDQEADRRDREGVENDAAAVLLRCVLRFLFSFVDLPRQAGRLA